MKKPTILFVIIFIALLLSALLYLLARKDFSIPKVKPSHNPTRIVCLGSDITEIAFALGLGPKIVAVNSDSDYPPETAKIPKVGSFWQPSTEAIIAAKPDLVITLTFQQQQEIADSLRGMGYNVISVKIDEISELYTAISQIGKAAGVSAAADKLSSEIKNKIDYAESAYSKMPKVRVLWVVQIDPLRIAGQNSFLNTIINLAGGVNAIAPTVPKYPSIGTEEILTCNPNVIIQSAMGASDINSQQKSAEIFWQKYDTLPAVKNHRIYVLDSDTVLRLGPRLPQGIEMIGEYLHQQDNVQNGK